MCDLVSRWFANATRIFSLYHMRRVRIRRKPECWFEACWPIASIKLTRLYEWWLHNSLSHHTFIITTIATNAILFAFQCKLLCFNFLSWSWSIGRRVESCLACFVYWRHIAWFFFLFVNRTLDRRCVFWISAISSKVNDWPCLLSLARIFLF